MQSSQVHAQFRDLLDQLSSGPGTLTQKQIRELLKGLPKVTELEVDKLKQREGNCPICFNTFLSILAEEEHAIAMDSPAHPIEELGVTKLSQTWQCGHLFCRKDISKWIIEGHSSCPMCRRSLLESSTQPVQPPLEFPSITSEEELTSFLNRMVSEHPEFGHHEERSEYTGMYS